MIKTILQTMFAVAVLTAAVPAEKALAFGDEPRWPGFGYTYEPAIESGCWRWNWQQYSWYDHCPVYVHPKAYMFSGTRALRVKG